MSCLCHFYVMSMSCLCRFEMFRFTVAFSAKAPVGLLYLHVADGREVPPREMAPIFTVFVSFYPLVN